MKRKITKVLTGILTIGILVLAFGCASVTVINSSPEGAKVYVDDQPVGVTPYTYSDTKIVGSSTYLRLEKEGYRPFQTVIVRNEEVDAGAVVGGLFVFPIWLWVMKYKPVHFYELAPLD